MSASTFSPGREPEQTFFADPAIDRAVAMIMTLAAELYVVKDRLRSLEVILERSNIIPEGALDHYVPESDEVKRGASERAAYVGELMRCALGEQRSKGAPSDLMQRFS
jgi:hypothetical protein